MKPVPNTNIPPTVVADKVAKQNGLTDVTKKLPGGGVKVPPATLPPKKTK